MGGAQGARAHQRAEGVSGGEAGVLSKRERKRRTLPRPSLFCCARGGIFAFCRGGVLPRPWHFAAAPVMHFVGAGVLNGPFIFSEGRVPRPRARVTFGRITKSDQKCCLKPQVSRLPARLGCAGKRGRVPRETQNGANRRTTNRLRPSYRCRSRVPRGGALVYRCKNMFRGPEGRTCTCRCRRHVRDLMIA